MLDLSKIDADDLSYDEYGKWGKPSGKKLYLRTERDGTLRRVGVDVEPERDWDVLLRQNKYSHPAVVRSAALTGSTDPQPYRDSKNIADSQPYDIHFSLALSQTHAHS